MDLFSSRIPNPTPWLLLEFVYLTLPWLNFLQTVLVLSIARTIWPSACELESLEAPQHSETRLIQAKLPPMNSSYSKYSPAASISRGIFVSPSWGGIGTIGLKLVTEITSLLQ